MKHILSSIVLLFFLNLSLLAVEPDEILLDNILENRAREISSELRCLVCRNENIDNSNAELARDLRILVRERLVLGDSDQEVISYVHARYGDFVLLRPKFFGSNMVLWLVGPISFLLGMLLIYFMLFRTGRVNSSDVLVEQLSDKEKKEIAKFFDG
ncbi:MAG: cytochrome c-type biogenesis protein CcmH [Paracoccaceae bacterium]|nr:cytochrome c-type biogenesis protein CcmH [Paracoccaceae bacterium]